jgi:hypothetical protein
MYPVNINNSFILKESFQILFTFCRRIVVIHDPFTEVEGWVGYNLHPETPL